MVILAMELEQIPLILEPSCPIIAPAMSFEIVTLRTLQFPELYSCKKLLSLFFGFSKLFVSSAPDPVNFLFSLSIRCLRSLSATDDFWFSLSSKCLQSKLVTRHQKHFITRHGFLRNLNI